MNNYNWNQAPDDVPNMSPIGLPATLYDVNLPTANVSTPSQRPLDILHYSAHDTETGSHSNHATRFVPTPQPKTPPPWHAVIGAAFKGLLKRNTTNVATGNIVPGASNSGNMAPGSNGAGTQKSVGTVTAGGARTA
jgi:hypothetical protein